MALLPHGHYLHLFSSLGISTDNANFLDSPEFLMIEKKEPRLLEDYAKFVLTRPRSDDYDERARITVEVAANFVADHVKRSGSFGKCIDASGLLLRLLHERDVWAFMVKGSVRVDYDDPAVTPFKLYSLSTDNTGFPGHVWICAPPYYVVDPTLRYQKRIDQDVVPHVVLSQNNAPTKLRAENIIWVADSLRVDGELPSLELLERHSQGILKRAAAFGVRKVQLPKATVTYSSLAIAAPDLPLDQMCDGIRCGETPAELAVKFAVSLPRSKSQQD